MTKKEVIEILIDYAGPLGPERSPEEQQNQFDESMAKIKLAEVEIFLEILVHPPKESQNPAVKSGWDFAMENSLAKLGEKYPLYLLEKLGTYLTNKQVRSLVISVIGHLQHQEGLKYLIPLVSSCNSLDEDETTSLACALGEIGGDIAKDLLEKMRHSITLLTPRMEQEIQVALNAIRSTI